MIVKRYISNLFDANCYLVSDGINAIIIDPCVSYEQIFKKNENSKLVAVFITHGHFDHILKLETYLKLEGIKFFLHKRCYDKLIDPKKNLSIYLEKEIKFEIPANQLEFVNENTTLNLLSSPISVIETPGHSDCSILIAIEDNLFTGDTLFKGAIGRTDLYSANLSKMNESLNKIKQLKTNYRVFPGHDDETYLQEEILYNPYLLKKE